MKPPLFPVNVPVSGGLKLGLARDNPASRNVEISLLRLPLCSDGQAGNQEPVRQMVARPCLRCDSTDAASEPEQVKNLYEPRVRGRSCGTQLAALNIFTLLCLGLWYPTFGVEHASPLHTECLAACLFRSASAPLPSRYDLFSRGRSR